MYLKDWHFLKDRRNSDDSAFYTCFFYDDNCVCVKRSQNKHIRVQDLEFLEQCQKVIKLNVGVDLRQE